jgi:Peptidoglycan-binding protein, CsiV
MRKFILITLCGALNAFALPATAQAQAAVALTSYDVELVIFRVVNPTGTPEEWSLEEAAAKTRLAVPDEDSTTTTANAPTATANFPTLPAARIRLAGAEDALKRTRNYRPIVHLAWSQPGFTSQGAQAVPVDATSPEGGHVFGQVTLSRGRYLHLTLDLIYEPPAGAVDAGHRYVIRQTRRMRSTERHYIDHPHFGVVALITPSPAE